MKSPTREQVLRDVLDQRRVHEIRVLAQYYARRWAPRLAAQAETALGPDDWPPPAVLIELTIEYLLGFMLEHGGLSPLTLQELSTVAKRETLDRICAEYRALRGAGVKREVALRQLAEAHQTTPTNLARRLARAKKG